MRVHDVRRGVLFGVTLSAVSLALAAVAWACTAAPYINVSPPAGAPGTTTTITGGGYSAAPVDITWVSAGSNEPMMSTQTNGPDFSVRMTTGANWAPGVYYVVAAQAGQSSGRASYRVTDGTAATSDSPGGATEAGGGSATSGSATAGSGSGGTAGETYGIGTRRGESPAPSGSASTGDPAGAPATQGGVVGQAQGAETAQRSGAARATGVAGGATGRLSAGAPAGVPAGGVAPAGSAPASPDGAAVSASSAPSPRTAASDLWGGFASALDGDGRSAPGLDTPIGSGNAGTTQALVIGLTTVGVLALLGGFAVAEQQQRRRRLAATTR